MKKKPFLGIALGTGFMILGVLHVAYLELAGATTSSEKSFTAFIGILLFLAGLTQVFYIAASSIRKRITHDPKAVLLAMTNRT